MDPFAILVIAAVTTSPTGEAITTVDVVPPLVTSAACELRNPVVTENVRAGLGKVFPGHKVSVKSVCAKLSVRDLIELRSNIGKFLGE